MRQLNVQTVITCDDVVERLQSLAIATGRENDGDANEKYRVLHISTILPFT